MSNRSKDIKKSLREKNEAENFLTSKKPFASGMYRFSMFIIAYYARVKNELNLDYDSFIIIQIVVGHTLYHLNKNKNAPSSYTELETEWKEGKNSIDKIVYIFNDFKNAVSKHKLSYSSICLVINLPKETVRRKVNQLIKQNLLKISKKNGIILGSEYQKIFSSFVPETLADVTKLLKDWEKTGVLKNILSFKF